MKKSSGLAQVFRRRQYVIDGPMQYGAAAQLLVGLGLIGLLFGVGMFVFLGDGAMSGMNLTVIREFLLMANAIYFVLAAVILAVLTLLLTHRFAGPAYVMDQAAKGMLKGDYGRRLALRKRDYMKGLAGTLTELRSTWVKHEEESQQTLEQIQRCLQEQRYEDAEKFVAELRSKRLVRPETISMKDHAAARASAGTRPAKETVAV
jgi:hypothetical protein